MSSPKHYSTYKVAFTGESLAKGISTTQKDYLNGIYLAKITSRIDSTANTGSYYIQLLSTKVNIDNLSNGLIENIPASFVIAPIKIQHTNGTDSAFDFDCTMDYIKVTDGLTIVLSTTEFTLTKVTTDIFSCSVLYK